VNFIFASNNNKNNNNNSRQPFLNAPQDRLPVLLAHTPAGASIREVMHFAQLAVSGKRQDGYRSEGKIKLHLCIIKHHITDAYWGVEVAAHSLIGSALDKDYWLGSHSGRFSPEEKAPVKTGTRWVGRKRWFGRCAENSPAEKPVLSHYTD